MAEIAKVNIANLASEEKWDEVKAHILLGTADTDVGADADHDSCDMKYSALLYAAYFNNRPMISWLIQHGIDINQVDKNDKTALHVAAKYGSPNVCRQLLMEGMDPKQKDYWGRTSENIAQDPGNIVLEGSKETEYTDEKVKLVERVFKMWPTIDVAYKSRGIEGLKMLQQIGGELAEEAVCYLALERSDDVGDGETTKTTAASDPPSYEQVEQQDTKGGNKDTPALAQLADKIKEMQLKQDDHTTTDIFISYCWADQELVRKLADDMKAKGYNIWIDIGQMGGGDSLFEAIDSGIRTCKVLISSVSSKYAKSLNCRREVSLASDIQKPIIPIIVDENSGKQWPPVGPMGFLLTGKLYVDLSNDYESGLEQLAEAVEKLVAE